MRRSPSGSTRSPAGWRGSPTFLEASKTRATVPQVRRWQELEIEEAHGLPGLFAEFVAAGTGVLAAPEATRLERAVASAGAAVEAYAAWLRGTLADGTDDWPIGRERHDALVAHRAFDGLDADQILELGWQKLAEEQAARVAAAREIDPDADEAAVLARIKADGPADFAAALERYRTSMLRARQHLIDHDLVTVPDDERIDVIETPEFLRNVIPFAAYFSPAPFDAGPEGHLRRHAVGRRRPGRDARAQPRLDQQHQHPRGLPGPPPPARRRLAGIRR